MSDCRIFRFTRNFDAGRQLVRKCAEGQKIEEAMAFVSKGKTIESPTSARPTRDFLMRTAAESFVIGTAADILTGDTTPEDGMNRIVTARVKP